MFWAIALKFGFLPMNLLTTFLNGSQATFPWYISFTKYNLLGSGNTEKMSGRYSPASLRGSFDNYVPYHRDGTKFWKPSLPFCRIITVEM